MLRVLGLIFNLVLGVDPAACVDLSEVPIGSVQTKVPFRPEYSLYFPINKKTVLLGDMLNGLSHPD